MPQAKRWGRLSGKSRHEVGWGFGFELFCAGFPVCMVVFTIGLVHLHRSRWATVAVLSVLAGIMVFPSESVAG